MIKELIKRIVNREGGHVQGEPLSPDEVELRSYLKKERRDRIKQQLVQYRRKEAREVFGEASLFKGDGSIIKSKNVFK